MVRGERKTSFAAPLFAPSFFLLYVFLFVFHISLILTRYFVLDRTLGLLVYWQKAPSRFFEQPAGMIHVSDLQQLELVELGPPKIHALLLHPKDKLKKVYPVYKKKKERKT